MLSRKLYKPFLPIQKIYSKKLTTTAVHQSGKPPSGPQRKPTEEELDLLFNVLITYPVMIGATYGSLYCTKKSFMDSVYPEKRWPNIPENMRDRREDTIVKTVGGFLCGGFTGAICGLFWPISVTTFVLRELILHR